MCFQVMAFLFKWTWRGKKSNSLDMMISIWHDMYMKITYYMNAITYVQEFHPLLGFWKICIWPMSYAKFWQKYSFDPFLSFVAFWVRQRNHDIHYAQINQHEYASVDVIFGQWGVLLFVLSRTTGCRNRNGKAHDLIHRSTMII